MTMFVHTEIQALMLTGHTEYALPLRVRSSSPTATSTISQLCRVASHQYINSPIEHVNHP